MVVITVSSENDVEKPLNIKHSCFFIKGRYFHQVNDSFVFEILNVPIEYFFNSKLTGNFIPLGWIIVYFLFHFIDGFKYKLRYVVFICKEELVLFLFREFLMLELFLFHVIL